MEASFDISNYTDNELVNLILKDKNNDESLFKELYQRHSKWVYNKGIQIVGAADAADVTQEIFVKVYLNLSKFKQESKFSTWLFSISYRMCLDYFHKQKKVIEFSDEYMDLLDSNNEIIQWNDEKVESALMEVKIEALSQILDKIEPTEKTILLMKYQDDMSIKEIMDVLNINEGATKMRLRRAKDKVLLIYRKNKL